MKKIDIHEWNKEKAQELFSLSHQLLDTAKQLGQYHAEELNIHVAHAMDLAKCAAQNDLKKLEQLQKSAATDASKRMAQYQKKAKILLSTLGNDVADKTEKHLDKARDSLSDWLDEAEQKMPVGGDKLAKVVRDISDAGTKAYKEGRKLVNNAIESADQAIHKATSSESGAQKPAVKSVAAKKKSS